MPLSIKEITKEEILKNNNLCNRLFELTLNKPELRDGYYSIMKSDLKAICGDYCYSDPILVIAKIDESIVGFAICDAPKSAIPDLRWIKIYIDKQYRRQKVGISLLDYIKSIAIVKKFKLFASPWDSKGIKFFERNGFVKADTQSPWDRNKWFFEQKSSNL